METPSTPGVCLGSTPLIVHTHHTYAPPGHDDRLHAPARLEYVRVWHDEVHTRVTELLGTDEHAVRTYGLELLYLLTEHPQIRAEFIAGPKHTERTGVAEITATRNALASVASRSLQATLVECSSMPHLGVTVASAGPPKVTGDVC
jgi:hypothetical protein